MRGTVSDPVIASLCILLFEFFVGLVAEALEEERSKVPPLGLGGSCLVFRQVGALGRDVVARCVLFVVHDLCGSRVGPWGSVQQFNDINGAFEPLEIARQWFGWALVDKENFLVYLDEVKDGCGVGSAVLLVADVADCL